MHSYLFLEKHDRQKKDEDKCTAHEWVGITDLKLGHRCHPEKRGDEGRSETAEYPGIKEKIEKKQ